MLARGLDPDFLLSDDDHAARDAAILYFGVYFTSSSPSAGAIRRRPVERPHLGARQW